MLACLVKWKNLHLFLEIFCASLVACGPLAFWPAREIVPP